eukprot:4465222-Amphidinium_carterae.1
MVAPGVECFALWTPSVDLLCRLTVWMTHLHSFVQLLHAWEPQKQTSQSYANREDPLLQSPQLDPLRVAS